MNKERLRLAFWGQGESLAVDHKKEGLPLRVMEGGGCKTRRVEERPQMKKKGKTCEARNTVTGRGRTCRSEHRRSSKGFRKEDPKTTR